jgi:hypothetical protein
MRANCCTGAVALLLLTILGRAGAQPPDDVVGLKQRLHDGGPSASDALTELAKRGEAAKDAVSDVERLWRGGDPGLAQQAAFTLMSIDPTPRTDLLPLAMSNVSKDVHGQISSQLKASWLYFAGLSPSSATVPNQRSITPSRSRFAYMPYLVRLGPAGLRALVQAMQSEPRDELAFMVGRFGPAGGDAQPEAAAALADLLGAGPYSRLAQEGLCEIGKPAVSAFTARLRSDDIQVRVQVLSVLGVIGADAAEAWPAILAVVQNDNRLVIAPGGFGSGDGVSRPIRSHAHDALRAVDPGRARWTLDILPWIHWAGGGLALITLLLVMWYRQLRRRNAKLNAAADGGGM